MLLWLVFNDGRIITRRFICPFMSDYSLVILKKKKRNNFEEIETSLKFSIVNRKDKAQFIPIYNEYIKMNLIFNSQTSISNLTSRM